MAGLYIHIPFCSSKCNYCNFFSVRMPSKIGEVTTAIEKELVERRDYLSEPVNTIYFGGGTPSLLSIAQIGGLLDTISKNYIINGSPEITLEANPDDINAVQLDGWKEAGINRLSIGFQSSHDEVLKYLSRRHNAENGINAIKLAKEKGFENISGDLIFGIPNQTTDMIIESASTLINLGVDHISAYALTVESKTALEYMIRSGKVTTPDDESAYNHFHALRAFLMAKGYEHYEVSNYALPGRHSRHNSAYWKGSPYLGVGPSAHSYNKTHRHWNIASISGYLEQSQHQFSPEGEVLSEIDQCNEWLMTGLRTSDGIDISDGLRFGDYIYQQIVRNAELAEVRAHLNKEQNHWTIKQESLFLSDGIISCLMVESNERRD